MHPIALLLAAFLAVPGGAVAQSFAVVDGEPVTVSDISQVFLWQGGVDGCVDRVKTLLTGEVYHRKDREVRTGGPRTQEEAQQEAERIKKQLIAEAIEEAINNKLKLQAAKKLGITISDALVEEILTVCAGRGPDGKPDLNALYADLKKWDSNRLESVQGIVRVQLAWRKMIRRIWDEGNSSGADPLDIPDESFSRSYLQELRQKAAIEYRGWPRAQP
jgi:peptidyl-prolyl cis-trans isomerase SurA